jgi:hypothetical protein
MTEGALTRCRDCGAGIYWRAHDRTGRKAPIDAVPRLDGNIIITSPTEYTVIAHGQLHDVDVNLYKSHFTTCPNAAARRQRANAE